MKTRIKVTTYADGEKKYTPQYFDPFNLICILVFSLVYLVVASISYYVTNDKLGCFWFLSTLYLVIIAVFSWVNPVQFWYSDFKKDIPDEDVAIKISVTFFTPEQAEHFIDRELKAYYKELESTNSYRAIRTEYIKYP